MDPQEFFEIGKTPIKGIGGVGNIQFRISLIGIEVREILP